MNKERLNTLISFALGAIGILAIVLAIEPAKIDTASALGTVKDLAEALIGLLTLIIAFKIKSLDKSQRFAAIAEEALEKIARKNSEILSGPKYNRENYSPDSGKGQKYLFLQKKGSKERAQVVPLEPLTEGLLEIRFSKRSGKIAHGNTDDFKNTQASIKTAILAFLNKHYNDYFEVVDVANDNIAVVVDFDENKLGFRRYKKALNETLDLVIEKIKE